MGKVAKYIEIETNQVKNELLGKKAVDQYMITKKINKVSNLELLDLFFTDKNIRDNIGSIYRSNPSYTSWQIIRGYYNHDNGKCILRELRKLLVISDNFIGNERSLDVLKSVLDYKDQFVRPIETWSPKSRNVYQQLISLIRHLFAKYPTPSFLEKSFFSGMFEGIYMYIHLGAGKSMKNYDGYPVNMIIHNKAAHHLYSTPDDMEFYTALRRVQVLYMGGDEYIFKALMRANVLRERLPISRVRKTGEKDFSIDFTKEEFWLSVMKFFIDNPMIEPTKIAEVIDYIDNMKFKEHSTYVDGRHVRVAPPHPNFSMKGRNPVSLINQSDQWHYERERLNRVNQRLANISRYSPKKVENFFWTGRNIKDGLFKRGKKYKYKVIQLLSFYDLRDEGNEMHHCVATYASSCNSGRCAIFSVREYVDDHFNGRTATLEIRENTIVQIRAKYNRKPDDTTISVIKEWANYEMLGISSYAL